MLPFFLAILLAPVAFAASQAGALISSAHQLPGGTYRVKNVGTGQYLTGGARNLYAGKGTPTKVQVVPHDSQDARHTVMGLGSRGNTKCVSAAWNYQENANGSGSLYSCVLGSLAAGNRKTGTLREAKQAFILVSAAGNSKRQLEGVEDDDDAEDPDEDLLVEQEDEAENAAEEEASNLFDKRARRRHRKRPAKKSSHKKSSHKKASHKTVRKPMRLSTSGGGYGPYYIIATDHITNMPPRALSGQSTVAMKQRVMAIQAWKKGNKLQQWIFEKI